MNDHDPSTPPKRPDPAEAPAAEGVTPETTSDEPSGAPPSDAAPPPPPDSEPDAEPTPEAEAATSESGEPAAPAEDETAAAEEDEGDPGDEATTTESPAAGDGATAEADTDEAPAATEGEADTAEASAATDGEADETSSDAATDADADKTDAAAPAAAAKTEPAEAAAAPGPLSGLYDDQKRKAAAGTAIAFAIVALIALVFLFTRDGNKGTSLGEGLEQADWKIKHRQVGWSPSKDKKGKELEEALAFLRAQQPLLSNVVRDVYGALFLYPTRLSGVTGSMFIEDAARKLEKIDVGVPGDAEKVQTLARKAVITVQAETGTRAVAKVALVAKGEAKSGPFRIRHDGVLWLMKSSGKWRVIAFEVEQHPVKAGASKGKKKDGGKAKQGDGKGDGKGGKKDGPSGTRDGDSKKKKGGDNKS